ncbi:MAG TPA: nitroreductase [Woeseiaceae bacterium]|nr:nitroreductase [Woeseiaceae bacterium]
MKAAGDDTGSGLRRLAERIRARRTVNLFLKQPVSRQLVLDAIEVARWAPNHHVTEPWHFYVLGESAIAAAVALTREVVSERKGAEKGRFKAEAAAGRPGWLVVTCRRSADELLQQEDYAACCCAVQNLMLYLSEAGLASKWSTGTIVRDARFFELLGADPEREFVVGLVFYGYPKITPQQQRRSVAEITTELS